MSGYQLEQIVNKAVSDSDIKLSDIPAIDLYIDQIITLINEKYEPDKRFPEDKILTKTMINNYSKEGLIKPVKGKKYSREHIVQMLMIYAMKNTLTIPEIKSVFEGIYKGEDFDNGSLLESYEKFIDEKFKLREMCGSMFSAFTEKSGIKSEDKKDILITLLSAAVLSTYMKNIAQGIIDQYFPVSSKKKEK